MTKQELIELKEKQQNEVMKQNEEIRTKLNNILKGLIPRDFDCKVERDYYEKDFRVKVFLTENHKPIFAADFTLHFRKRTTWINAEKVAAKDTGLMEVNKGTVGGRTKLTDNGAQKYCDILLGEVWKREDEITEIYNNINWEDVKQYNSTYNELQRIEQDEIIEKHNRERNELLSKLYVDRKLYCKRFDGVYAYIRIERITPKRFYISQPKCRLFNSSMFNKDYIMTLIKNDVLKFELPEGAECL